RAQIYIHNQRTAQLSLDCTRALQEVARKSRVTLNTILQSAWSILLSIYSENYDIVFGNVVTCRPASLSGVELMVGPFINTLPVRIRVDREEKTLSLVDRVQRFQVEAQE